MKNFWIEFFAKLLSIFIFSKKLKRKFRGKFKTFFYGFEVVTKASHIGKNFICYGGKNSATKNTFIGDDVSFNGVIIRGNKECYSKVVIGNCCQFGENILIISQSHNYDKGTEIPYDNTKIYKDVIVEDFVWCGSNVTIVPGAKIGEGAIIQAGSVVCGEIPPYAIAGGNPAKAFKYRDIEHFKELKEKGCFKKQY